MNINFFLLFVFCVAGAVIIRIYNRLVRDRQRVKTAWSDIDVQLKRRHDLIPQLISAVTEYAEYEQATVAAITELRTYAPSVAEPDSRANVENELGRSIQRLIAVAENYPDLKANQGFLNLQENLSEVETAIQHARRFYNGAVRNLNVRVESFPDLFVANLFKFRHAEFFEFEPVSEGVS